MKFAMVVLLAIVLLVVVESAATTRYFSTSGNNAHPCTEAQPCLTASTFEASLAPGDRMLFKRGDHFVGKEYRLEPKTSGSEQAPIYYGAYGSGAKPIIDSGDPAFNGHGGGDGLKANVVAWLVIEDLQFTAWSSALQFTGVTDSVVRRISSTGGSSSACILIKARKQNDVLKPSQRILLEDVEVAKCGINSNGEGVYIGTNPGQDTAGDPTSDITLRKVYIHDRTHDEGVDIKNCARRITIEQSYIAGAAGTQGHGIALAPSSEDCPETNGDHHIQKNRIEHSSGRGIHVGTGATLRHNVLLHNQSVGIWIEDLPGDDHPVLVDRNVIIDSAGAAIQVQENAASTTMLTGNLAFGNDSGNTPFPPIPPQPPLCCTLK